MKNQYIKVQSSPYLEMIEETESDDDDEIYGTELNSWHILQPHSNHLGIFCSFLEIVTYN